MYEINRRPRRRRINKMTDFVDFLGGVITGLFIAACIYLVGALT